MEYKICEQCGAKLHVRTLKCPICNTLLTDASKIINEEISPVIEEINHTENNSSINQNYSSNIIGENIDVKIPSTEPSSEHTPEQPLAKDYVYKAEVYHSIEYTKPLSNMFKVILTAISMFPLTGQFIGTFLGIFFATHDDNDRKSFGTALIILSIVMFMVYTSFLMFYSDLVTSGELTNYINNFVK